MVGDDILRRTYHRDVSTRQFCLTTSWWCYSGGGALYPRQHPKVRSVLLTLQQVPRTWSFELFPYLLKLWPGYHWLPRGTRLRVFFLSQLGQYVSELAILHLFLPWLTAHRSWLLVLVGATVKLEGGICSELSDANETEKFVGRILFESVVGHSLLYNLEESALI